jgi:hypothetical protein
MTLLKAVQTNNGAVCRFQSCTIDVFIQANRISVHSHLLCFGRLLLVLWLRVLLFLKDAPPRFQ